MRPQKRPVKPIGVKENLIEADLVWRVRSAGGICEKVTALGTRGFFDRIIVMPGGKIYFAEVKRPRRGVLSPQQRALHQRYKKLGVPIVIIKTPEDITRLIEHATGP